MVRKPRIAPRPPADWDAEVLDALAVMARQGGTEAALEVTERDFAGVPKTSPRKIVCDNASQLCGIEVN